MYENVFFFFYIWSKFFGDSRIEIRIEYIKGGIAK